MKTAICILSYNMPHLTDGLYSQLKELVKIDASFFVFDNGSDPDKVAKCTTHREETNTRLTGGMNHLLKLAKGHDAVWLCTNDIKFITKTDPLATMLDGCNRMTGIVHPSLIEPVPNYAYKWMIHVDNFSVTLRHPMVDIICPLYKKEALDVINWEFDPIFTHGWGIDYDSCWRTREAGLDIQVDHRIICTHQTSVTYDSGKDKEFKNRNDYYSRAGETMNAGMTAKYGANWRKLFF